MINVNLIKIFYLIISFFYFINLVHAQNEYKKWLLTMENEALDFGISKSTYRQAISKLENYNQKVLYNYNNQPEVKITFNKYFYRNISQQKITKGSQLLKLHASLLNDIEDKLKVPAEIIVAIWGIETNYGTYTGNYKILEALSTLAYKSNRKKFFKKEFFYALKIIEESFIEKEALKGSWAGAMGQGQFMPSSYIYYAIDFNQDHKIDIWESYPDIFASIGNYLNKHGWRKGEPWAVEIDYDNSTRFSKGKKYSLVEIYDNTEYLDVSTTKYNNLKGNIISIGTTPNLRSFLVYSNFYTLKKYNNSNFYALTLGDLANRIKKEYNDN